MNVMDSRVDRICRVTRHRRSRAAIAAVLLAAAVSFAPIIAADSGSTDAPDSSVAVHKLEGLDRSVSLNFTEMRLEVVLDTLARRAGFEVDIARNLRDEKTSLRLDDVTVRQALELLGQHVGVAYSVPRPGLLRVDRSPFLAGTADVTNPRLIPDSRVEPVYPESMRAAGLEGHVILQAVVDETGSVGQLSVLKVDPQNQPDMVAAAIDSVQQWRYEPATRKGRPVPAFIAIYVDFGLDNRDGAFSP